MKIITKNKYVSYVDYEYDVSSKIKIIKYLLKRKINFIKIENILNNGLSEEQTNINLLEYNDKEIYSLTDDLMLLLYGLIYISPYDIESGFLSKESIKQLNRINKHNDLGNIGIYIRSDLVYIDHYKYNRFAVGKILYFKEIDVVKNRKRFLNEIIKQKLKNETNTIGKWNVHRALLFSRRLFEQIRNVYKKE